MKSKKKNSIYLKTQIYLFSFCIIILLTMWFAETSLYKVFYRNYQKDNASNVAYIISSSKLGHEEKNVLIENLAYEHNLCISVYEKQGVIREYNTKMSGCYIGHDKVLQKTSEFNLKKSKHMTYHININNNQGYLYAIKADDNSIFIYAPLQENMAVTKIFRSQLIYITILCIIISCALASFISKKITEPIRCITQKATNIGKEKYNNSFEETGIKEIDELSETLDNVQTELGKVQTYQKDLMANVTHDLKTPLTMIKAYAEKIKDISYKDKDKLDNDVSIIVDEVDRLTTLVNDILDMSALEQSDHNIFLEEYDLTKEIGNILKKYEIICEKEGYKITTRMPPKALVKADKKKINQVIYNLVNNAINFTGEDHIVKIDIENNDKTYLVKVIDSGKGIKTKELKNIWTRYYKNDKNHKRNVVSSGLGLTIVKEILEKHNFKYGVNSKNNKGSEFYFYINKTK